ncbi:hypothetical protein CEP54_014859 [Fusarium duplospermum]|uniref:Uncharacterized protein n=1 Tax=Fusarium duplospermum TaxID=1325734 RepID=A0A428NT90_9HYPO|nr:hypothetical protein CEP54_014859 [Fusarium duplospermum]
MADENTEGMKQDLASLRTRLAALEGLLGLSDQFQLSDGRDGLLYSDQEIDGGGQTQDNVISADQVNLMALMDEVEVGAAEFQSGLMSLESTTERQGMPPMEAPRNYEENTVIQENAADEDNDVNNYEETHDESPARQATLQIGQVANEDGHSVEGTLETSESAGHKRKSGWNAINAKKRRITRVDDEEAQGPDQQETIERPVEDEAMPEDIRGLVAAVLSRDAIKRFVEAVEYSKRPLAERARKPLDQLELKDGNPDLKLIAQRGKQLSHSEERTNFESIFTRYDQLQYAQGYQALKDKLGYERLPTHVVAEVCHMNGVSRETSKKRNKTGKQWDKVCAEIEHGAGLLALVPSSGDYLSLAEEGRSESLKRFHHELQGNDYVEAICAVVVAWFEAVDNGKKFKSSDDVDWDSLEEDEVVGKLQCLTAIR